MDNKKKLSKDEFIEKCSKRPGTSVEKLCSFGFTVVPCDCGEDICEGWKKLPSDK